QLAPGPFSAHMIMHMGVVAVAAPLLAVGIAGGVYDPVRSMPRLFPPVPLSLVELVVVWAWHAPALHHFARSSVAGVAVEQLSFLVSGLLVWLSALGGGVAHDSTGKRPPPQRAGAGVLALLLTSMHMTLLGALLALPPRPLYLHDHGIGVLEPLHDQHLGGAIMLLAGGASYLVGGLWLSAGLLQVCAPFPKGLMPSAGGRHQRRKRGDFRRSAGLPSQRIPPPSPSPARKKCARGRGLFRSGAVARHLGERG
ncbi:MAG TPA: cytochrome c oxidase assembly protein, partial [Terriglobales bacterium]|nr:cytochrome c oxidase assembly protein [Terriglobales bacterium]